MTQPSDPKKPEAVRIRIDHPAELRAWANQFGVSVAELHRIMAETGNHPDKVWAYLNTRA
ncbi:MAG: DUF3606 domain-containing protein [Pseudomonadota bacterium]